MKILNFIAGCQPRKWVSPDWVGIMIFSLITATAAADELPPPPPISQYDTSGKAFEDFLTYLAEFEGDDGEWVDPLSLEQDAEDTRDDKRGDQ